MTTNSKTYGKFVSTDNLATVDKNLDSLALDPKVKNYFLLPAFKKLKRIYIGKIGSQTKSGIFQEICNLKSLTYLSIKWLQVADLTPLENLQNLESLQIYANSKADNLESIGKLRKLKRLTIWDFPKVHDITPLSKLTQLELLVLEGGMWKSMNLKNIKPLEKLVNLKRLEMANLHIEDKSLRPIAKLKKLEELGFANFFPVEEVGYLKKNLPHTKCQWFTPTHEFKYAQCKKCGHNMVFLTGKGTRMQCPVCDKAKIAELTKSLKEIKKFH